MLSDQLYRGLHVWPTDVPLFLKTSLFIGTPGLNLRLFSDMVAGAIFFILFYLSPFFCARSFGSREITGYDTFNGQSGVLMYVRGHFPSHFASRRSNICSKIAMSATESDEVAEEEMKKIARELFGDLDMSW